MALSHTQAVVQALDALAHEVRALVVGHVDRLGRLEERSDAHAERHKDLRDDVDKLATEVAVVRADVLTIRLSWAKLVGIALGASVFGGVGGALVQALVGSVGP